MTLSSEALDKAANAGADAYWEGNEFARKNRNIEKWRDVVRAIVAEVEATKEAK